MDADTVATVIALGGAAIATGRSMWHGVLRRPVAAALCRFAPGAAVSLGLGVYEDAPAQPQSALLPPPAHAGPGYAPPVATDEPPLLADEWRRLLNDEPNVIPHLAVYGPSGSGKSTLILALLDSRKGDLVITTKKNAEDDPWGGFPAARLGVRRHEDGGLSWDWSPVFKAIYGVFHEAMMRHADGSRPRTPLTLVIDELTSTIAAAPDPKAFIAQLIDMWLTARSVNVRLIVMDPTANVKGWGLDGRGDVRESIGFVRCDRDKSAMLGELDECRRADGVWLDTRAVPHLAAMADIAGRAWVAQYTAIERAIVPNSTPRADSIAGDSWEDQVRDLASDGASTRQILAALGGDYNKIVKLAREAREERG